MMVLGKRETRGGARGHVSVILHIHIERYWTINRLRMTSQLYGEAAVHYLR